MDARKKMMQYLMVVGPLQKLTKNFPKLSKLVISLHVRRPHGRNFDQNYCIFSDSVVAVLLWNLSSHKGFELVHHKKMSYFGNENRTIYYKIVMRSMKRDHKSAKLILQESEKTELGRCFMKRDHKSAKLILQESEKTELGRNERFLVFCRNHEKYHSRTYVQNIRVGEGKFFVFCF